MNFDWRGRVILEKLAEGQGFAEAATAAGMTRQGVWWRMAAHPEFRQAVEEVCVGVAPVFEFGGH